MKKSLITLLLCLCCSFVIKAQTNSPHVERPRLVIGIVVDQMRWDYLYRFYPRFGEGGFRRLMNEGFSCDNTHLNYIPTVTAIGHSSIYTGSVPSIHGIAGNNFYKNDTLVYCTDDPTVTGVGSNSPAGKMSPRNLLVTTIGDELKLATNFRSRVIGVALKDRASILPAGHTPDAAYWFDDETGRFITSTYYRKSLPQWLNDFNQRDLPDNISCKTGTPSTPSRPTLQAQPTALLTNYPLPTLLYCPCPPHTCSNRKATVSSAPLLMATRSRWN